MLILPKSSAQTAISNYDNLRFTKKNLEAVVARKSDGVVKMFRSQKKEGEDENGCQNIPRGCEDAMIRLVQNAGPTARVSEKRCRGKEKHANLT